VLTRIISRFFSLYDVEMAKYATALKTDSRNPDRGHQHKRNSKAHLMGVEVATNSLGLRDKEYAVPKPPGTYRIMVLGDSVTLGWGVEEGSCYAKRLEALLNENLSGKTHVRYEVINAGVGNYGTVQEWAYFKEEGRELDPDMVIVGFFVNDAEPVPKRSCSFVLNHSRLAVFVWSRLKAVASRFSPKEGYRDYYLGLYDEKADGWVRCKAALKELIRYCKGHKKRVLVAFLPELHDLGDGYPFKDVHEKVRAIVTAEGADYFDLYPVLKGQDPRKLWVSREDVHPNRLGHEWIAEGLYRHMLQERIPE